MGSCDGAGRGRRTDLDTEGVVIYRGGGVGDTNVVGPERTVLDMGSRGVVVGGNECVDIIG
jgi:hypothetical protein